MGIIRRESKALSGYDREIYIAFINMNTIFCENINNADNDNGAK